MHKVPKHGPARSAALLLGLSLLACGGREDGGAPNAAGPPRPAHTLADSAFRVEWSPPAMPAKLVAGQAFALEVKFKNASDQIWPDKRTAEPGASGAYAVRLSYRIWPEGEEPQPAGYVTRADLPAPLAPGAWHTVPLEIVAPAKPGRYNLQFDLVEELVVWFADRGAAPLIVKIDVQ